MKHVESFRLFVNVVNNGSFASAARQLDMTPSNVSKKISNLEASLNTRLVNRTTRKLSLTQAGELFYQHGLKVLSTIEEAIDEVENLSSEPRGTLKITAPTCYGKRHIAPHISQFLGRYPGVEVNLQLNDDVIDLVEQGFDLGFRTGKLLDSSLIAKPLLKSRVCLVASPAYLHKHGIPSTPSELVEHNCLVLGSSTGTLSWRFELEQQLHRVKVNGSFFSNDLESLISAAKEGVGILSVSEILVREEIASGQLTPVLTHFTPTPEHRCLYAIFSNNKLLPPKVRAFIDFIGEKFQQVN